MMKLIDFKDLLTTNQYPKVFKGWERSLVIFSHWGSLHYFFTRYVLAFIYYSYMSPILQWCFKTRVPFYVA